MWPHVRLTLSARIKLESVWLPVPVVLYPILKIRSVFSSVQLAIMPIFQLNSVWAPVLSHSMVIHQLALVFRLAPSINCYMPTTPPELVLASVLLVAMPISGKLPVFLLVLVPLHHMCRPTQPATTTLALSNALSLSSATILPSAASHNAPIPITTK